MSRNLFSSRLLRSVVFFSGAFLALFAQLGRAQDPDRLSFFKNYFITGDVIVAGTGNMRGTGVVDPVLGVSLATATINFGSPGPNGSAPVPCTLGTGPSASIVSC